MSWPWVVSVGAGSAVLCALVLARLVPALRARAVLDQPGARSLHEVPVPRGGGIAVVLSMVVCTGVALAVAPLPSSGPTAVLVLAPVLAFAVIGVADDCLDLPARPRLVAQLAVGLLWATGWVTLLSDRPNVWLLAGAPVAMAGMVATVNLTNFMDGANGLVSLHALVTGAWFAVVASWVGAPGLALASTALAGSALGFVPFNLVHAKVFLGDVGSYGIGAAYAALGSLLVVAGTPLVTVLAPLTLLLADSIATLCRRFVHGDRVFEAHRLHVYQRLVAGGWTHLQTSLLFAALSGVCALLSAATLTTRSPSVQAWAWVMVAVVGGGYLSLPRLAGREARWGHVREVTGQ